MKYIEFFQKRKNTFIKSYELMCNFINKNKIYNIVELGSSRSYVNNNYKGCMSSNIQYWKPNDPHIWDWGAGIFTKVFSDNLLDKNYMLYTIDPDINANIITKNMCKNNNKVLVIQNTSTDFLKNFDKKIDFLYMDHLESDPNNVENTALTHLHDIKIILDRNLKSDNGIILIDDVGEHYFNGKGKYSIPFLLQNGYQILIQEYQALLIKN